MDARLRILKMLEQGKISSEEALKLLSALKEEDSEKKELFGIGGMVSGIIRETLGSIPDIVGQAMSGGFDKFSEEVSLEKVKKLNFSLSGGEGNIIVDNGKSLRFKGTGIHKISHQGDEVSVKLTAGEGILKIPHKIPLSLFCAGGEINGEGLAQDFSLSLKGGEANLKLNEVKETEINLRGGELNLTLLEDASFTYRFVVRMGKINFPAAEGKHKGQIGQDPKGDLFIDIRMGEVNIEMG